MALVKQEMIQYVGVSELEPEEQLEVSRLSTEYYPKIKRQLKNIMSLVVHIKKYEKGGSTKFSIHVRVIAPSRLFESCKSHDFDLARALHKSFEDVQSEMRHKLHTEEQSGHASKEGRPKRKSARAESDIRGF